MEISFRPLVSPPGFLHSLPGFRNGAFLMSGKFLPRTTRRRKLQISVCASRSMIKVENRIEETDEASGGVLQKKEWIHFVGIGGNGLSAIAMLALKQGSMVSGSDLVWSSNMSRLEKEGARVHLGHCRSNIRDYDGLSSPIAIVKSSAIPADNEEILFAEASGIPVYSRRSWLGKITDQQSLIAVSGTHGKSTTTAMIAFVLNAMGENLTALVGAHVPQFSAGNVLVGCGGHFVLEADEYDGSFLDLLPSIIVVTNIEWEHVDLFEDEEAVLDIFKRFLLQIRPGGHIIACGDCAGVHALLGGRNQNPFTGNKTINMHLDVWHSDCRCKMTTYGISDMNEWHASSIHPNKKGGVDYLLHFMRQPVTSISLQVPGVHNVLNSLAAIATVASLLGDKVLIHKTVNKIKVHLTKFLGVSRRFELIGKSGKCQVYDDYAHHPTEVLAVLRAARELFPHQALWVVFQPHTFSRLAALLKSFASSFSGVDYLIVTQVYPGREVNLWNVHEQDLVSSINGPLTDYIPRMEDVINRLLSKLSCCDDEVVIFTLGAGTITTLGPIFLTELRKEAMQT